MRTTHPNQHWISQFLLQGFAKGKNTYRLDKTNNTIEKVPVKVAASQANLLLPEEDECLKGIESRVNREIRNIRKNKNVNGLQHPSLLNQYAAALHYVTPEGGANRDKARADAAQETAKRLSAIGLNDETSALWEVVSARPIMLTAVQVFCAITEDMRMAVLTTRPGALIINDAPLLIRRSRNWAGRQGIEEMLLPIKHDVAIHYSWDVITSGNAVEMPPEIAHRINHQVVTTLAGRYAYARDRQTLERATIKPPPCAWQMPAIYLPNPGRRTAVAKAVRHFYELHEESDRNMALLKTLVADQQTSSKA